jgi:hypothetical protein
VPQEGKRHKDPGANDDGNRRNSDGCQKARMATGLADGSGFALEDLRPKVRRSHTFDVAQAPS